MIFVVIFIRLESICYVCLSTFFYFPIWMQYQPVHEYLFIILLICNSTVDQKYKNKFVHFKDTRD